RKLSQVCAAKSSVPASGNLTPGLASAEIASMNAEAISIARRAAVYAALGDPARLAIVDALLLGDRSPSELGEALGMPSNLLAHHLRLLEQVGVIERERS